MTKPILTLTLLSASLMALASCAETDAPDSNANDAAEDATAIDPASITPGNGEFNRIELNGVKMIGSTLSFPEVMADSPSFVVIHPFKDGAPLQTDYVGAFPVPEGTSRSVSVMLDNPVPAGTPMIAMLHDNANEDGVFDFGDGVTVADNPVFEGTTIVALPMAAPEASAVTPDHVKASYRQHEMKAVNYRERVAYRGDGLESQLRALMHDWMHLIERPDRNAADLESIMSEGYRVGFPSGDIQTSDALGEWLDGPGSSVMATAHDLERFSYEPLEDGRYALDIQFNWTGLAPDGDRLHAKTQHEWTVAMTENGPRIDTVDVTIIEPMSKSGWAD